ncbi:putative glycine N-acyltransferase-like protein 1B [Sarcophilus harrisii]
MYLVCDPYMMKTLHQSLAKNIPESLKVYGSIYFIIHGNPFNLEVVVDSWPDYQTVITRPKKKEMVDKLDQYTNTYHIFTKDFHKCQQFLETPGIIDWNQVIQIQACQESIDKILRKIATSKSLQIEHLSNILFVKEKILQLRTNEGQSATTVPDTKVFESKNLDFKFTSLNASHAKLVNDNWSMGLNEKSLNYVLHCIKNLPSFCLLNSEGNPISLALPARFGSLDELPHPQVPERSRQRSPRHSGRTALGKMASLSPPLSLWPFLPLFHGVGSIELEPAPEIWASIFGLATGLQPGEHGTTDRDKHPLNALLPSPNPTPHASPPGMNPQISTTLASSKQLRGDQCPFSHMPLETFQVEEFVISEVADFDAVFILIV